MGEITTMAVDAGAAPDVRPEQGTFVVEEHEMESEASAENVALADTALARLLVKLWRARQAGPHAGAAREADSAENALDLLEPQCPDVSRRCVLENR
jgi:hypothetical protein